MSRAFAYARVSTIGQETENQTRDIRDAGFSIEPHRIITETVSGSVAMAQRKGFSRLLDKMEQGDLLVVTELERLGRDAIDVSMTAGKLEMMGIRLHCLTLGRHRPDQFCRKDDHERDQLGCAVRKGSAH